MTSVRINIVRYHVPSFVSLNNLTRKGKLVFVKKNLKNTDKLRKTETCHTEIEATIQEDQIEKGIFYKF